MNSKKNQILKLETVFFHGFHSRAFRISSKYNFTKQISHYATPPFTFFWVTIVFAMKWQSTKTIKLNFHKYHKKIIAKTWKTYLSWVRIKEVGSNLYLLCFRFGCPLIRFNLPVPMSLSSGEGTPSSEVQEMVGLSQLIIFSCQSDFLSFSIVWSRAYTVSIR